MCKLFRQIEPGFFRHLHRAILLLGFALWFPAAHACTCLNLSPVDQPFAEARAVFVGTMVSTRYVAILPVRLWYLIAPESVGGDRSLGRRMVTSYRVERAFKGVEVGTLVQVQHIDDTCCMCGFKPNPGERKLIFASWHESLMTSGCGTRIIQDGIPTPELEEVEALVKELRSKDEATKARAGT